MTLVVYKLKKFSFGLCLMAEVVVLSVYWSWSDCGASTLAYIGLVQVAVSGGKRYSTPAWHKTSSCGSPVSIACRSPALPPEASNPSLLTSNIRLQYLHGVPISSQLTNATCELTQ